MAERPQSVAHPKKSITDDDIARIIGNRAIRHLREMYPAVYEATYPSCRLSLRNTIRNDIVSLMKAIRGRQQSQDYVQTWPFDATDEDAGIEPAEAQLAIANAPDRAGGGTI